MRVLIITQYFWPEDFRINEIVEDFSKKGHKISILTGEPNYPEGYLFKDYIKDKNKFSSYKGCEIKRLPVFPRGSNKFSLLLNYFSFVVYASIYGIFNYSKKDFDNIFVFEPSPITVCLPAIFIRYKTKIPVTLWVLDLWPQSLTAVDLIKKDSFIFKIIERLVKFIYKNCDLILGQSPSFVNEIKSKVTDEKKVKFFPNWCESTYLDKSLIYAKEIDQNEEAFKIIFAGNIGEAQDFPTILNAIENLSTDSLVRLYILGDGRKLDWVKREIKLKKLESKVFILGRFPSSRMNDFFLHADALLVSLKKDPIFDITIPGKLQSYLASSKPIIAVLNGEGKRVIKESMSGIVVEPGNVVGLTAAFNKMSQLDTAEIDLMGTNGFNYAEKNFKKETTLELLDSWMKDLA